MNKRIKRIVTITLIFVLSFSVQACGLEEFYDFEPVKVPIEPSEPPEPDYENSKYKRYCDWYQKLYPEVILPSYLPEGVNPNENLVPSSGEIKEDLKFGEDFRLYFDFFTGPMDGAITNKYKMQLNDIGYYYDINLFITINWAEEGLLNNLNKRTNYYCLGDKKIGIHNSFSQKNNYETNNYAAYRAVGAIIYNNYVYNYNLCYYLQDKLSKELEDEIYKKMKEEITKMVESMSNKPEKEDGIYQVPWVPLKDS